MALGGVTFSALGTGFSARAGIKGMLTYQETEGNAPFLEAASELEDRATDLVFFAGLFEVLLAHNEGMSRDRVLDILDEIGFAEAMSIFVRAIDMAMPQEGDPVGNAPGEVTPPTPKPARKKTG